MKAWCTACNAIVEAVVETSVSKILVPAAASALGALIGAGTGTRKRDTQSRAIVGSLLGAALGAVGHAIISETVPAAQKLVCGKCGCAHSVQQG